MWYTNTFYGGWGNAGGMFLGLSLVTILILLWSLFWKALALWHSARRGQSGWFVAMLVINTLGILEIIYLFGIAKLTSNDLFKKEAPTQQK